MTTKTNHQAEPDLAAVADRIKASHRDAREAQWSWLDHARKTGDLLREAKEQVKAAGELWEVWVEERCGFSIREAQRYMLVSTHFHKLEKLGADRERLSLREALALLADDAATGTKGGRPNSSRRPRRT